MVIALHVAPYNTNGDYRFLAGSIAVDFFFLVSGYLFCQKYLKTNLKTAALGQTTFNFLSDKIKKFLPWIAFSWALAVPVAVFIFNFTPLKLEQGFFNLLYLPIHKNPAYSLFGVTWYIAAMLVVQTVLLPFLLRYKENFVYIASFIIVYFVGNYLFIKFSNLSGPWGLDTFCYKGVTRAFFGINLGMIVYILKTKFEAIKFTRLSRAILTVAEILGYLSVFVLVNKPNAHNKYDYLMILILATCILISFSNQAYLTKFSNNRFFYYLEKLSLPIYLNQFPIIEALDYALDTLSINMSYYLELFIVIIISILLGIIEIKILGFLHSKSNKIKRLFISQTPTTTPQTS